MSTKQDIIELRKHVMNLYKKKDSELEDLKKNTPGDSIIKHHEICLKAREMSAVAECLNIIYDFEHEI